MDPLFCLLSEMYWQTVAMTIKDFPADCSDFSLILEPRQGDYPAFKGINYVLPSECLYVALHRI
jgi:hypothetical protein